MSSDTSLSSFLEKFFPNDVKRSLGIFSSDIGVFYSLTLILMTFSILPNEISTGRLVLPLCAGHTKNSLFLSKQLVYSTLCALPVFPIYILYYSICIGFLENNYELTSVIFNAALWVVAEFSIVFLTIGLSVLFKRKFYSLAIMASVIMVMPDLLSFFKFGKLLPTYILTYLYSSENEIKLIAIPLLVLVALLVLMECIILWKKVTIEVDERR